jgi:hypothetical protein
MSKLKGGINANINKKLFEIPDHLIFNLPKSGEEKEEEKEEPIIEKPKSINEKIKELFYDPKIGLISLDKFYKKSSKTYSRSNL